jgi:RNA polymerase sigma-70 factor (ECF subfamily)
MSSFLENFTLTNCKQQLIKNYDFEMISKQEKFLLLFNPIKKNLWRFCLSITYCYDDAKDLLQDTIEIAYKDFDNLKHYEAFLSWLFSIASRKNYSQIRKNLKNETYKEENFEYLESGETQPDKLFELKLLSEALNLLPYEQKEAIILSNIMGFSQKEVSNIQGVSIETLKQRIYRGKTELKLLLNTKIKFENEINNNN